ncbi:thrombopoietin receptor isoform X1 [Oreochromis niloticus]|uniref:MPL proto-oncogene, thrombopoietin receptor n=1 Tax=Oreochromis niloticus TaxID=8128 RepID=I3JQJ9_ORENI|nr:thrombopoietin receptor isoform X1 [Oreochromis niloticus]
MNLLYRLGIFLNILWIQAFFVPGVHCNLSEEDVLFLKDEPNPKCFSRTTEDFTCFFETADNRTYNLFYSIDSPAQRCELSVQRTEKGTLLHICYFPNAMWFVDYIFTVTESFTNATIYTRTLFMNNHILLDPPVNLSLHPNGQVGQLNLSWTSNIKDVLVKYRIEHSSEVLYKEVDLEKEDNTLDSLKEGEEVKVQVAIKPGPPLDGPWSRWSDPARAVVPQSADDIALLCFTSDLQNVTCHWNSSKYDKNNFGLFYQILHRKTPRWTGWTECVADEKITDLCCFHGGESREVRVKLTNISGPKRRTFYTGAFTLNNAIKTSPPTHLKRILKKDKLCLKWDAPLPSLSNYLQYEFDHQLNEDEGWKYFRPEMVKGPKTEACVEVPAGSQYRVRVRAKPAGPIYSGFWSDWSKVLSGENPSDSPSYTGMLLIVCIPVFILITATISTTLCALHIRKVKQYFWPPIPNPEKVLQGYLTEINTQKRDHPVLEKLCSEETTTSVVEIMSEEEVSEFRKLSEEFAELLSSEGSFTSSELVDGSPGTEIFPDYVTLNKDSIFLCSQANTYIYEHVTEKGDHEIGDEYLPTCSCSDGSVCASPCLCSDLLNHSYLPLAEPAEKFSCKVPAARSPGNIYTNFP